MVDAIGPRPITTGAPHPVARVASTSAPTAPVAAAAPMVESTLASVAQHAAAKPPVDAERVAEIRKAVADGTFPISPAKIADRLIALRYDWQSHDA